MPFLYSVLSLVVSIQAFASVSLKEAITASTQRSETILDREEQIKQAEEHYSQAFGSILPTLTGTATYFQQQDISTGTMVFPTTQPLVRLTLTQPLFRGLRELYGLRQTRLLGDAARAAKEQAIRQLSLDVAQNYFSVLSLEQDRRNLDEEIQAYVKRKAELKSRVQIGRSRNTEILTLESSLLLLKSQIAQIDGQIAVARETFLFLTGKPVDSPLVDIPKDAPKLPELNSILSKSAERPEIKAAQFRLDAASEGVSVARGAHLPSVDLTGNYYFLRAGLVQDVKWDFGITLSLPIFNGGLVSSRVSEATSLQMQSELAVTLAKRQAEQEIRSYHKALAADLTQLANLEEALDVSKRNFEDQTKEYRFGLVTNLDVLQALTAFEETQRALDRARYQAQLDSLKLNIAAGLGLN